MKTERASSFRLPAACLLLERSFRRATLPAFTPTTNGQNRILQVVGEIPSRGSFRSDRSIRAVRAGHYEAIGRSRLTNDTLIATSATRRGITVLTLNAADFERIATVRPDIQWRLWP